MRSRSRHCCGSAWLIEWLTPLGCWCMLWGSWIQGGNVAEYHRVKERVSALLELRAKVHFEDDIKVGYIRLFPVGLV